MLFTYVALLDILCHVIKDGPAGAVVDLTLAGGGHVLVRVHHNAAVLDVLLLSVIHQRVSVTGCLDGGVTVLKA